MPGGARGLPSAPCSSLLERAATFEPNGERTEGGPNFSFASMSGEGRATPRKWLTEALRTSPN